MNVNYNLILFKR